MAQTAFTTDDALTKKAWEEKLYRDTLKESYFDRFMSPNENSIVQVKTQLEKSQGDKIPFGIAMRLNNQNYVTSGETLEGKEQVLTTHDYSVSLEEYVLGIRDNGPMTRKRAMFSIDETSVERLRGAGAELIDQHCFDAISTDPSKVFYATSAGLTSATALATAKAALTATDSKVTPSMLNRIAAWAKTGGNRAQTPLRPIKIDGKTYYVFLAHPDTMSDLYEDSTFQQAMREAEVRGKENPLFQGSTAIWRNVIVHEHENVKIGTDAGSGSDVPYSQNILMGAQALVWAWGKRPEVIARDFDYGRQHGYAFDFIAGFGKVKFNSKDYGCVSVMTARTNVSGL